MTNQVIADVITLSRLIAALVAPFLPTPWAAAVYIYAMFSDGIDGVFADPHKTKRWYDKLPLSFDELADFILWVSCIFYSAKNQTTLQYIIFAVAGVFVLTYIASRPRGKKYTTALTTICAISTVSTWWITCLSLLLDIRGWVFISAFVLATALFLWWRITTKKKQGKNSMVWTRPNQPRS